MRSILIILVVFYLARRSFQKFVIPEVAIQAIKPKGIVVSLKDSPGIQYFAFHGNVNNPIKGKEEGSISKKTGRAENGLWQVKDENVQLKVGDVVYYWVFVQHNRLGFDKQEQKFTVTALEDSGSAPTLSGGASDVCTPSITTKNGGQRTCSGEIIFEDNFNTIDGNKWNKQLYIADNPDFEFVSYEHNNVEIFDGIMHLKANIRDNVENMNYLDFRGSGCTGVKCYQDTVGILLPPVIAGQVKSKVTFKYGTIEIRAQLPKGDWVYPELFLEDKDPTRAYSNNRIWLAYSRGNADLKTKDQRQIGNTVLYAGPVLSNLDPFRSSAASVFNKQGGGTWSDEFHTIVFTWKPDVMSISVDGNTLETRNSVSSFNKELLVTLGIAVGGKSDFPDECSSGPHAKPWKRTNYRATRAFFEDKNNWLPTWQNNESVLKIDSIKIKAL